MQVNLIVVGGVHNGRVIPIKGPEFLIGRDSKCQLRPASNDIDRQHCAIVLRDDRIFLRDYGSRQGTRLNRRTLLGGELQLEDGDTIEVGPLVFKLGLVVAEAGRPSASSSETDDDLVNAILSESSADETLLTSKPTPPPRVKKPGDERELLCLD
jgi:pSer/pThr/pTyr-binding forkhead associated (FHA) protein